MPKAEIPSNSSSTNFPSVPYVSYPILGSLIYADKTDHYKTGCGLGSMAEKCRDFDIACTCKDQDYLRDLSCCISKKCETKDVKSKPSSSPSPSPSCSPRYARAKLTETVSAQFAKKLCGGVGVTDVPASATCAPGANPSGPAVKPASTSVASSGSESVDSTSDSSDSSSSSDTSGAMVLAQNPLLVAFGAVAAVFV